MNKWKWIGAGLGVAALGAAVAWAQYRDIEKPAYAVVETDGPVELRDYQPMIVAEVTHTGDRRQALNAGFRRLAAYIFAEDRPGAGASEGEKIAMTSPVIQDQSEEIAMTSPVMQDEVAGDGTWRTRFVMPAKYSLDTLPTAPEDITLTRVEGRRIAAIQFSGRGTGEDLATGERALRAWMADRGLIAAGPAEFAFYDAPMVPPPLRRNEVLIPVEKR